MLPHGDQRKLELAIILAPDPKLLLLDEPTAGMAAEQVPEMMKMIERASKKKATRPSSLSNTTWEVVMNYCDRITVMHQGRNLA